MLHRQATACWNMSEELQTALQGVVRLDQNVKSFPWKEDSLQLCYDMGAEHTDLPYFSETHWLCCSKVHHRVFDLKEETGIFSSDINNNDNEKLCYNEYFIQKLAYFLDIFKITRSNLNNWMQGPHINTLTQNGKFDAFVKKSDLWKRKKELKFFLHISYFRKMWSQQRNRCLNNSLITYVLCRNSFHCT
jgi:hypothetical protein